MGNAALPFPGRVNRRDVLRGGLAAAAVGSMSTAQHAVAQDATPAAAAGPDISRAVAAADQVVNDIMARSGIPGLALAIVANGEILHLAGYGVRELGKPEPVDPDTVFQLASVSKPITSTAIATAVGRGVVGWDDPVVATLPEFALSDPWQTRSVTIADCLCHRTGLRDHAGDALESLGYVQSDILRLVGQLPAAYGFRDGYAYTNFAFTAGGAAAANAAVMTWADFMREMLFAPAGMTSADAAYEAFMARENRAISHLPGPDGAFAPGPAQRNADQQAPAGGSSASISDLARFMLLIGGNGTIDGTEIIPAVALDRALTPVLCTSQVVDPGAGAPAFSGLGWGITYTDAMAPELLHSGAFSTGASTAVGVYPAEGFGFAVLTNALPVGGAEAIIATLVEIARYGAPTEDWYPLINGQFQPMLEAMAASKLAYETPPADAAAPGDLDLYAGRYANAATDGAEVGIDADGLTIQLGASPVRSLQPWDGDTFVMRWTYDGQPSAIAVSFMRSATGDVTGFTSNELLQQGVGVFTKLPA